ncbi:MAG: M81 family metallopeptidase [Rhodospirillales bacterium]
MSRLRVAVGGIQHETNTFAPMPATWQDFVTPGGWPGLSRGPELLEAVAGANLPAAGAIDALKAEGHAVVPLTWANASPSAQVTRDAFERFWAMLKEDLQREAGKIDALYLDLHGAMVTEHLDDGEGELLARVRALVGASLPVVASLDLHANVTPAMVAHADALVAYRTYPHIDMAETGARAARALARIAAARGDGRPAKAFRQIPFLVPIAWQSTFTEPGGAIYARVIAADDELARTAPAGVSLAMGFPLADIHDAGPSVVAYGATQAKAQAAADEIAGLVMRNEGGFAGRLYDPDEAVREAVRLSANSARPVVLADTQDNSGGGAPSDSVGLLEALVRGRASGAALGILCDEEAAAIAHRAGTGAEISIALGGKKVPGHKPFNATFKVRKLNDGRFTGTGPFYKGLRIQLGPMAALEVGGVQVAVSSRKMQAADQAMFRHVGIDPPGMKILGLKSSVHFRADFQPLAEAILVVAAPGVVHADLTKLKWKKLRPGVRLSPRAA